MEQMVNVFLMGKKYEVPASLTIMKAMEYAGYQLVRGCGCRNGFCGACATIYRIKGDSELKVCLACQTQVEDNMYVATLPFFPLVKQVDVYKRQLCRCASITSSSLPVCWRRQWFPSTTTARWALRPTGRRCTITFIIPVSYTHLDVYKRQKYRSESEWH